MNDDAKTLVDRLADEADQCRNDDATDIAKLLDEAREALLKVDRPDKTEAIQWPVARDVGRIGDMSPSASLRVGLDSDNDVYVSVWDESGGGSVEFCCPGAGGGRSPKTRMALIELMRAMEADNAVSPSNDWWAKRLKGKAPE
ncbi:MAG: hypothetical protein GAK28_04411 [Luteibacter sp.]|uniref:hypothetical protein n=1 Tax=Luteibacter sp. TaxID=1886636 RepID=UPI001380F55F|nr:hypothetical protein [Luteibacter sp.]KAF1003948.1 MAG: hypothetical protein GAK28_04411 [Luteibacter sp.]